MKKKPLAFLRLRFVLFIRLFYMIRGCGNLTEFINLPPNPFFPLFLLRKDPVPLSIRLV